MIIFILHSGRHCAILIDTLRDWIESDAISPAGLSLIDEAPVMHRFRGPVAQWIEQRFPKPLVGGSTPLRPTSISKGPRAQRTTAKEITTAKLQQNIKGLGTRWGLSVSPRSPPGGWRRLYRNRQDAQVGRILQHVGYRLLLHRTFAIEEQNFNQLHGDILRLSYLLRGATTGGLVEYRFFQI